MESSCNGRAALPGTIRGDGTSLAAASAVRLFDHLTGAPAVLDDPMVTPGDGVTHLRYPVRKA